MRKDLQNKIVSKMEAKILRSLDQLTNLNTQNFGFKYRVFSNFPLPQLFRNATEYLQNIDSVIGLKTEDYSASDQVIWPSIYYPVFEWKIEDGVERAFYCSGGPYTKGRSVYEKMKHSDSNTKFWKGPNGRKYDNAAQPFLKAISESKSETELNAALNSAYPRITTTNAEIRKTKLMMQSIDFIIAKDYGNYQAIDNIDLKQSGVISPIIAIEFDGITNAFTINGELRFSEEFGMKLDDGTIDYVEQAHRHIKLNDKFQILKDLEVPSAFLPHHAIEIMSFSNGLKFVKSDIIIPHLSNIHSLLHENNAIDLDSKNVVEDYLASNSFLGNQYSTLKSMAIPGSLVIEQVLIDMSKEEDEAEPVLLGYNEFIKPLEGKGETILSELGMNIESWPGIRISVQHLGKHYSHEMPFYLGFGCNLMAEYDYCMFLGLAASSVISKINQL